MLRQVATELKPVLPDIVFVGGAITSLFLDEIDESDVRRTDDVDIIVEVVTYASFARFEESLRSLGFRHSSEHGAPICRWNIKGIKVDIMPTRGAILGFRNRWYPMAFDTAVTRRLDTDIELRHASAPCFLATKIDAFDDRGAGDFYTSHDIEDIVSVINGRSSVVNDCRTSPSDVCAYLADRFADFARNATFRDALSAHLRPDEVSQSRKATVLDRLLQIADSVH